MCGIVGAVSERNIVSIITECLKRLEYRGYDSAGIAIIDDNKELNCVRAVGKIDCLLTELKNPPLNGKIGIAHTRWATHGIPAKNNAHPHLSHNTVAVVHNGIIENYENIKKRLIKQGIKFTSDTDTEVIVHLIYSYLSNKVGLVKAVQLAIKELVGAYALAIVSNTEPDKIIAVRLGSPVVIGLGINENFVASDAIALLPVTNNFIYLENGDIAVIERSKVQIYNAELKPVKRPAKTSELSADNIEKGNYRHFMQKEIFEQPRSLADTIEERLFDDEVPDQIFGNDAKKIFTEVKRIQIVACGSSFHAGLVGQYWIERLVGISCRVEIASEFCYRDTVAEPNTLFVTISQSGETADTLSALHKAKKSGYLASLTICNVPESSLVRGSNLVILTRAGIEIGVATTKAFTAQLTVLLMLAISLSKHHKLNKKTAAKIITQIKHLPVLAEQVLKLDQKISKLAKLLEHHHSAFYLGRGLSYPIALEGALKIKEISYIHAEGYPAGELKHGALALIDDGTPVVVAAPNDEMYKKISSNLHEVSSRGGILLIFADSSLKLKSQANWHICQIPEVSAEIAPIIYTIPLQLLAYHVALLKGTDIDQPRNLAKSVTVE